MPHHAHAQWQGIAEGLSSLLDVDFVDLVFKVRGKPCYLSAHRALIAAAWPSLREDLRKIEGPPPMEARKAGLAWAETAAGAESREARTPTPSAGSPLPLSVDDLTAPGAPSAPSGSPACGAAAGNGGVPRPCAARVVALLSDTSPPGCAPPGVLDVSSKMLGSYSIMRALLCHLYNKPVVIQERDLPMLRAVSLNLGNSELVKCCDDLERRPVRTTAWAGSGAPGVSRSNTPEPLLSDDGRRAELTLAATGPSCMSTSASAGSVAGSADDAAAGICSNASSFRAPGHAFVDGANEADGAAQGEPVDGDSSTLSACKPRKSDEKIPFTGEARAMPMAERSKPRGERSFQTDSKTVEMPQTESGCVRHVLSDIKRSMAESSRIIVEKTFNQTYAMVPGERGILGEGINGPVRMATHRKTGREVAVKRISCVNLSEQRRQMLVSEVSIFLQVSHRNIVQLLEVHESEVDQAVLLTMELCTGRELFERLAERKWYSEFDAARVARQMLDAVSYLHSQNICHRDLKLENWLYENPSQEAKLKLCDFGFGQIVEPSVQLTATLGSLFYVAPEVLEGSYGLPCDMWSIGVIVYMLLSGVPPFDGKTDADVMGKIRQGRFVSAGQRWEGISETAKHFVRSMLRKDPYERLTAAEAAQHAWLKMECKAKHGSHQLWQNALADPELELPIDRGVIRDMWKFAQSNAVTRAALGMLAKFNVTTSFGGREEDVLTLEQRFRAHDDQNTGKIDAESFVQVLKETLHLQISTAEEKQFFERITFNIPNTGESEVEQKSRRRREVNYAEFITLTKARRMANNTAAIREAFRTFDKCGDGYVKEDDMHKLLGDEFKSTIENYVGINGNELIDYLDFASILSQEMAKKEATQDGPHQDGRSAAPDSSPDRGGEKSEAESAISGVAGSPAPPPVTAPVVSVPPTVGTAPSPRDSVATEPRAAKPIVPGDAPQAAPSPRPSGAPEGAADEPVDDQDAPRRAASDAQSDEECDADAASDEEQLVNVKKEDKALVGSAEEQAAESEEKKPPPRAEKKKVIPEKSKEARFSSFSLSLAGSSEYDDVSAGVNRVMSMPSDKYSIKQLPGFHSRTLRPFYAARPVSNVVMGLIRGTSLYARQSVAAKLATIIHTTCGWFFIMPNPKYHTEVDTRKGLLSKETGKFRFVAWWIHPRFVPQLRQWFERLTYEGLDQERQEHRREARAHHETRQHRGEHKSDIAGGGSEAAQSSDTGGDVCDAPAPIPPIRHRSANKAGDPSSKSCEHQEPTTLEPNMGAPGDFRFSDVPKPENYLHTYRDLHTREHVNMLGQLVEGTRRFLRSLFDENFMDHAFISAGFHYPVRTQYATLHMQLRVNAGNICGEDGRGIEVSTLIETLKRDRLTFERDSDTIKYYVTENVKVSLLAAASEYEEQNAGESACRQISPLCYELGHAAMPTIHDMGEEEDEAEDQEAEEAAAAVNSHLGTIGPNVISDGDADVACAAATGVQGPPPESQIAENHEAADEIPASYLLNIQPSPGSAFHTLIYQMRQKCADDFGYDPTYLYPLHVSVTGFFEASAGQIRQLIHVIPEMIVRELRDVGEISVGEVICTKTGYILFDMKAAAVANFAQRLGETSARQFGLHIRPKAVNHISLACNRPSEEVREKIRNVYEPTDSGEAGDLIRETQASATFDLVLSRLISRSSFERFAEDGPHKFAEVARIPLQVQDKAP